MKLTAFVTILGLFSNIALADCDWSRIVQNPNDTFTYSKELHICVGTLKRDLDIANTQLDSYKKAIELKDLAITKADERSTLWRDTSFKLEDRVNSIDSLTKKNEVMYFVAGVLFTSLAVWGAGHLATK